MKARKCDIVDYAKTTLKDVQTSLKDAQSCAYT